VAPAFRQAFAERKLGATARTYRMHHVAWAALKLALVARQPAPDWICHLDQGCSRRVVTMRRSSTKTGSTQRRATIRRVSTKNCLPLGFFTDSCPDGKVHSTKKGYSVAVM
jgi:hypothetical protein